MPVWKIDVGVWKIGVPVWRIEVGDRKDGVLVGRIGVGGGGGSVGPGVGEETAIVGSGVPGVRVVGVGKTPGVTEKIGVTTTGVDVGMGLVMLSEFLQARRTREGARTKTALRILALWWLSAGGSSPAGRVRFRPHQYGRRFPRCPERGA